MIHFTGISIGKTPSCDRTIKFQALEPDVSTNATSTLIKKKKYTFLLQIFVTDLVKI
jgi:hypothetical protein